MPPPTLEDSLELVSRGDRAAFSDLYDEISPMVYGLALRITKSPAFAEEVSQEVFVQVWQQAGRFNRSKGSAKSWIATLAHRRAVDFVRRNQSAMDRDAAVPVEPMADDVAELAIVADEHDRVRLALVGLSDTQREAITLAYYGGLTYREVAERLNSPEGTVKTRIRDGLRQLRSELEDHDV
jgi:RNA polymerase sigma-70 factor, ECF subfamily